MNSSMNVSTNVNHPSHSWVTTDEQGNSIVSIHSATETVTAEKSATNTGTATHSVTTSSSAQTSLPREKRGSEQAGHNRQVHPFERNIQNYAASTQTPDCIVTIDADGESTLVDKKEETPPTGQTANHKVTATEVSETSISKEIQVADEPDNDRQAHLQKKGKILDDYKITLVDRAKVYLKAVARAVFIGASVGGAAGFVAGGIASLFTAFPCTLPAGIILGGAFGGAVGLNAGSIKGFRLTQGLTVEKKVSDLYFQAQKAHTKANQQLDKANKDASCKHKALQATYGDWFYTRSYGKNDRQELSDKVDSQLMTLKELGYYKRSPEQNKQLSALKAMRKSLDRQDKLAAQVKTLRLAQEDLSDKLKTLRKD